MKYNLKILLFALSLLSIATFPIINKVIASSQSIVEENPRFEIAQSQQNRELNAYANSQYDYWDARVLASYWQQSTIESKARISRKIIWGEANIAILEQYLVDARIAALTGTVKEPINFFSESQYTYNDAEKLAKFWGDPSPYDAKLRIGRNLILGQEEIVARAMREARQNPW